MDFEQLIMDVFDEAGVSESDTSKVDRADNGDGTVTLSVSFALDPKVVAEKAKAMKKGIKRDDLSDDIGEEVESDSDDMVYADDQDPESDPDSKEDEDEDPYNGVNVEDSLFGNVLDEINGFAEDAKIGRHGLSPLENCRAKDPKFCPYHGQRAWQAQVENDIAAAGVTGATVSVTEEEHGTHLADSGTGRFSISVKCNSGDESKVAGVLNGYLAMKGIKDPTAIPAKVGKTARGTHAAVPGKGVVQSAGGAELGFVRNKREVGDDKYGTIQERLDDLMDDPNMDYGNQEQMDMLNNLSDILDNKIAPLIDDKTHELKDPNDQQKYDDLEKEAFDKYNVLSARINLPNVNTMQDVDDEFQKTSGFAQQVAKLDAVNNEIDSVKGQLGWKSFAGGGYVKPRGENIGGHEEWMDWFRNVSHFTKDAMAEARQGIADANQKNDVAHGRVHLRKAQWAASNADFMAKNLDGLRKTYLQGLYDWAKQTNNQGLSLAFPNGRPQ